MTGDQDKSCRVACPFACYTSEMNKIDPYITAHLKAFSLSLSLCFGARM